jgi:error-prone DNA polymerase
MWKAKAIERNVPPLLRLAESALGEPSLIPEAVPSLPNEAAGQSVVMDYTATGLTLRQHPLELLRPTLRAQGYHDTRRLNAARQGTSIRLPGIVLMRQRPGTAKGIVVITIEDEFGVANLIVYTDVGARDRAALIGARLLVAEGRIERETDHAEVPITHLICRKLIDRSDLLQQLSVPETHQAWIDATLGHADEVRRPDPGSARAKTAELPGSRDFR